MEYVREVMSSGGVGSLTVGTVATVSAAVAASYLLTSSPTPIEPAVKLNNQSIRLPVCSLIFWRTCTFQRLYCIEYNYSSLIYHKNFQFITKVDRKVKWSRGNQRQTNFYAVISLLPVYFSSTDRHDITRERGTFVVCVTDSNTITALIRTYTNVLCGTFADLCLSHTTPTGERSKRRHHDFVTWRHAFLRRRMQAFRVILVKVIMSGCQNEVRMSLHLSLWTRLSCRWLVYYLSGLWVRL